VRHSSEAGSTARTRRCWLRRLVWREMTRGDDNFVGVGDGAVIDVADDTSDQKEPAMPTGLFPFPIPSARRRMLSAQTFRQMVETFEIAMSVVTMRCAPGRIAEHGVNVGIRA
jgi:hypothetical protein